MERGGENKIVLAVTEAMSAMTRLRRQDYAIPYFLMRAVRSGVESTLCNCVK